MKLLVLAHERGAHRDRPHPYCPSCAATVPTVEAEWVRRAARRMLPVRIEGGMAA